MKITVGMSGGVDSSVTALLLKQQGFAVEGLFMKNWNERSGDDQCLWQADVEDALQVCERLDIPLNTIDLSGDYWDRVFKNFLDEYRNGRTPNPDVLCNQEIKFKAFADHALHSGAEKIATGHYARIVKTPGGYELHKGIDNNKDQSYFLCRLNQQQLAAALFPVGELDKTAVRARAEQAGLITHDKKDSTGICFIGEQPFRDFLSRYIPPQPGDIRTTDDQVIGEHQGVFFYTLGQRQGLGIGGVQGADDAPWYVVQKDLASNTLIVAQDHDHPLLHSRFLEASGINWISGQPPATPLGCQARVRYRQSDQACTVDEMDGDSCRLSFAQSQRAVTPGQFVVLYQGDQCLGGGIIDTAN
ncbi:MAG: tRNA 2-thiouridine(34) synthase MnmA [Thiotrichales bacterium]|nr:tRNA 2-thiouridine(34) synthase MnmA [Thiotrichales bacterium]